MMVIKKMCTLIAFVILLSFASGEEAKGSLTFVIDDTSSMQPDIDQVKEKTSDIFAAVQNSNASQMDEFIIVTFNDPYFDFRIKTNDSDLFTKALIEIQPGGGGDCPEMAMAGIQEALEHSKRNSFLYVFTDASAVDYDQYENVKSLAQQKSIQVNFLLTGECEDDSVEQHLVYDHLAAATSGQVFHIDKDDISKIIEYILANLRNKRIILLHKTYEYTRRCNNLKFTVDSKVWEILIALSASRPLYYSELIVYGPGGTKESIQDFIITENTIIVKMQGKAGEYVIEIIDCEGITIVVSAATSVSFSHGFSPIKPSSLDETSTKPVPGTQSYLAIALTNEERDITLKTVEIRDTDDNLIPPELPLKLVDNDKQFYITNLFTPPTKTFTIAVIGYTKLNEKITRVSQTSIEYHTPLPGVVPVYTAPTVTVLGPKKVPGDNQKSVSLKCKVTGFPKPEIWWEDEFHIKSDKDKLYEIAPNEYLIVLLIIVSRTVTFTCKAKNFRENSDNVTVTVQKAAIVTILEGSELTVYNNQPITLNCKVEGFPEPAITWEDQYQNVLPSQIKAKTLPYEYISTFHINKATVTDSGTYICKAKNFKDDSGSVKVTIIKKTFLNVLEYPKDSTVEFGDSLELNLKIDASPPATISWYKDGTEINSNNDMEIITSSQGSSLKIKSAEASLEGKYSVIASNGHTADNNKEYDFKITVTIKENAATVTILEGTGVTAYEDQPLTLNCKVEGFPAPTITWEDQYQTVLSSQIKAKTPPYEYISTFHINKAAVTDSGTYICKAKNFKDDSGSVKVTIIKKTFLNVLEYPKDSTVEFGDSLELNLKIDANPPATISWCKDGTEINSNNDMEIITSSQGSCLKIKSAEPSLEKQYSVIASNVHTTKKYEFKISVTIKPKAAIVTILEGNDLTAYEDQPITLNCKVEGFPAPTITWEDQYQNALSSQIIAATPPYEYISIFHINKAAVPDSGTYICKAKNNFKDDSGSVKVIIKKKTFFNVLQYPKDMSVEYGKSVELHFKINAQPPANIIWYLDGKDIRNDNDFDISLDSSVLKIKNAQPGLQGKYYVKASNVNDQVKYEFHVTVTGTEVPKINKHINSYTKHKGSSVDLECRIMQGKPKPVISWSFDRNFLGKITNLKDTGEFIRIDHVTNNDVGTYRCEVLNVVGLDHHEMELYIEYPPTVKLNPSKVISKKGDRVLLACDVDGSPTPNVRWFVNNMQISYGIKYKINRDYTLSFTGLIEDYGKYACEASNYLKTVRAEVSVFIYEPPKIEPPIDSKLVVKLRTDHILSCNVKGHPKPKVQWFHLTQLTSIPIKINCDKNYNVKLDKVQAKDEGFYRCTADNGFDKDEFTYTVNIQVPAAIIPDFFMTKDIYAVEGDLSFILTCIATGSPKPDISWQHDGIKIGSGGGFKISNDGTLTVNNVVLRHSGTYTCTAENIYNKDTMIYDVHVDPFPTTNELPLTITIIEGNQKPMHCGLSLDKGFLVRWFKDGVFIKEGDLTLTGVTKAHAGYYICRVNTPGRSYTFPKNVIVGTPPKFITAGSPTVMFKDGAVAKLDCSATGEPAPRTTWWRDHTKIDVDLSQYSFIMDVNNIGQMMCHVSNEFDTIKRSFDFIAEECLMNIENDFTARQPILIAGYKKREWPVFKVSGGTLRMRKQKNFKLFCPNSFISYGSSNYGNDLKISCAGDSLFELGKRAVKASDITCNQPVFPVARNLSVVKCLGHDTKILHVGFDVDGAPMNVFRVCFNEKTNMTLYAMHSMHKAIAHTIPKHVAGYTRGTTLSFELDEIYDCGNQVNAISPFTSEKCCFKRRQLVNPMDVLPGISQVATYHYLNVVPQWSSCGTENWDEVERRVRLYALNSDDKTLLWTGAAYSVRTNIPTINLRDKRNQELQVPQFIWRVVERQFVIIHVNIPGLTLPQALTYVLCYDICDTIPWMKNPHWHDVDKGFIYCCYVDAFENAFNYQGIFYKDRFLN